MKEALSVFLIFFSIPLSQAQSTYPIPVTDQIIFGIQKEFGRLDNIPIKDILQVKREEDLFSLSSENRLHELKCNLDSIDLKDKQQETLSYLLSSPGRQELSNSIEKLEKYIQELVLYTKNKALRNQELFDLNKDKVLAFVRKQDSSLSDEEIEQKLKEEFKFEKFNSSLAMMDHALENIQIGFLNDAGNQEDGCHFLKYRITYFYLLFYKIYMVVGADENMSEGNHPAKSLVLRYCKPLLEDVINNKPGMEITTSDLDSLFTYDLNEDRKTEKWHVDYLGRNTLRVRSKESKSDFLAFSLLENRQGEPSYLVAATNDNDGSKLKAWHIVDEALEEIQVESITSKQARPLLKRFVQPFVDLEYNQIIIRRSTDDAAKVVITWNGTIFDVTGWAD